MQILVVTNCSARKTEAPASDHRARSLPRGAAHELAMDWRARCSDAGERIAARRLYAGRAFSIAYDTAKSTGAELRIVSAGMGLLHPDTPVPSYSLTLSRDARDC